MLVPTLPEAVSTQSPRGVRAGRCGVRRRAADRARPEIAGCLLARRERRGSPPLTVQRKRSAERVVEPVGDAALLVLVRAGLALRVPKPVALCVLAPGTA